MHSKLTDDTETNGSILGAGGGGKLSTFLKIGHMLATLHMFGKDFFK